MAHRAVTLVKPVLGEHVLGMLARRRRRRRRLRQRAGQALRGRRRRDRR